MAEVLAEYFRRVIASDFHDYGYGLSGVDFRLDVVDAELHPDWIITNPPFKEKAEQFALLALERAKSGVAIFAQLRCHF